MKFVEEVKILNEKRPLVKGVKDLVSGKFYYLGENPFMDMQIDNCLLWKNEYGNDWFGFIKSDYELVIN